ncbi:MAG: adenylate/guanylate cyclase domain-containing protein [Desulfobacterales bacterium]|nr:MAG: adenylate/guanylate cyclase domain-containing protein [Desulfobacterales bacterium]
MAEKGFKRKLTAILSADAVEYSRLMGEDEEATVRTLTAYREVLTTLIQQHNGKVLDSPGDNLLAEFASVVDAVQCAVAVQKEIKTRNDELPENRRMQFRIGINLGDVIQEKDRIYGDGVNIAARLEGLADSGGICISKTAFDHIESKLPYGYEFLGDQTVKNIAKPVGAYRVLMEPRVTVAEKPEEEKPAPVRRMPVMIGVIAVLVVAISLVIWHFYIRRPSVEPASVEKMAYPLPDKPSIAVLPFNNLSGDPDQEYFCDGMTEDLITDLSKISGIFVIARNSTFAYKGKPVKINQVAEELGVRFVLEGSVRKADNKVRITAQLIDAINGHHIWAERYTGIMEDVFNLQDKITQKIIGALAVKLTAKEKKQIAFKGTDNIDAYDVFLQGWDHYLRSTPEAFRKAIPFFENAVKLDPYFGQPYAALALTYWRGSYAHYWTGMSGLSSILEGRLLARHYLEKAIKMPTSLSHRIASSMALNRRQFKEAIEEAERAIALNSNDASCHYTMAEALVYGGKPNKGIEYIETAMRLDPRFQTDPLYLLGIAHFCMRQYEKAVSLLERALKRIPAPGQRLYPLVAAYAHLGRFKEAKKAADVWAQMLGLKYTMYRFPFKDPEVAERFVDGLIKAGYPALHSDYYKLHERNKLTGEEIGHLVVGQKVATSDGIVKRTKDGNARYQGFLGKADSGKSWIKGDLLCDQWQERYGGYKNCYPVFRNPDGSRKNLDEYLSATDFGIITWSPVE